VLLSILSYTSEYYVKELDVLVKGLSTSFIGVEVDVLYYLKAILSILL